MSGVINDLRGDIQITVFENKKEKDNQPDFNIVISTDRDQQQKKSEGGFSALEAGKDDEGFVASQGCATAPADGEEEINPDDIPF